MEKILEKLNQLDLTVRETIQLQNQLLNTIEKFEENLSERIDASAENMRNEFEKRNLLKK